MICCRHRHRCRRRLLISYETVGSPLSWLNQLCHHVCVCVGVFVHTTDLRQPVQCSLCGKNFLFRRKINTQSLKYLCTPPSHWPYRPCNIATWHKIILYIMKYSFGHLLVHNSRGTDAYSVQIMEQSIRPEVHQTVTQARVFA